MTANVLDELLRYVRFDVGTDGAALRALAPHARPAFARIADEFYGRAAQHPEAAAVFSGPAQVERLKCTLAEWLELLLVGPWDDAYYEKRLRIGRRHVGIQLPQRYMFGGMALVRQALAEVARSAYPREPARLRAAVVALGKILDVELAVMLESYAEEAAEQVRQVERLRRDHLAAIGTLAGGLAHEIRNPLNAAHLQLTLAQKRLRRAGGADLVGALGATGLVATEMARLAGLVDEFLQFARPTPVTRTRNSWRAVGAGVVERLAEEAARRGVELVLEPAPELLGEFDPDRMRQVLLNLLQNGLEAAGRGGHVRLRLFEEAGAVVIEVLDDGPGLAHADAPIFEPFFTTKPQGTGLGLSIVHRVVSDHGGRVEVERRSGETCFRVTLPMSRGARGQEG